MVQLQQTLDLIQWCQWGYSVAEPRLRLPPSKQKLRVFSNEQPDPLRHYFRGREWGWGSLQVYK